MTSFDNAYIPVVKGDLLDVDQGFIVHQVNCQGVMGSGVAAAIRFKYPSVYSEYKRFVANVYNPALLLGQIQLVPVTDSLTVVNLFGQQKYGPGDRLYTQYGAVRSGFKELAMRTEVNDPIRVPHLMGCALAGGDWDIYSQIIKEEIGVGDVLAIKKV